MSTAPIKWKSSSKMLRTLPTFCSSLASRNSEFSTMVSARALLLAATCCAYLWVVHGEDSSFETRSLDGFPMKERSPEEKDLIEALQEVLQKLRSKEMPSEKKLGWLPSCDAGEQCAVRKGARIGTLCGCPRGTACNFYVLKCL